LLIDATLQCWGGSLEGQLGIQQEPVQVNMPVMGLQDDVTAIGVGAGHACAIVQGEAQCWGYNFNWQVGNSRMTNQPMPSTVAGLDAEVVQVEAGTYHSCALLANDKVMFWGSNFRNQLGSGPAIGGFTPVQVEGLDQAIESISVGDSHGCALYVSGGVKCWGDSQITPTDRRMFDEGIKALSAGGTHTCALTDESKVLCWGQDGAFDPVEATGFVAQVVALSAGGEQTCALLVDGSIQCWGKDPAGPKVTVEGLSGDAKAIDIANEHQCALLEDGGVQCWGKNTVGQLGDGTTIDRATPGDVVGLQSNVQAISVDDYISCALLEGGAVRCWGSSLVVDPWEPQPVNVVWTTTQS
jgi:alpha-tubulin suppressor-like RCC1 family protein